MNEAPLDVINIIEEELRSRLKACHMKGYTLVSIRSGIHLSTLPNKRKAVITWAEKGHRWGLELSPEFVGFSGEPLTRGWNKLFDINTVDIEQVLDIMVMWMCGYDVDAGVL